MIRRLLTLALLIGLCTPAAVAQDEPKTSIDDIAVSLRKAQEAYLADLDEAKEKLLAAFDEQSGKIERNGKLKVDQKIDSLEQIQRARAEFEATPAKLPAMKSMTGAANEYRRKVAAARAKCGAAFNTAAEKYGTKKDLASAKAVLAEKAEFLKDEAMPADDKFGVGTKLTGTNRYSKVAGGKRVDVGHDIEIEITKRSGKMFTAVIWGDRRQSGVEVEGTIDGVVVKFKATKALTDNMPGDVVNNLTFAGRLKNGALSGFTTKPKTPDQDYKGEINAKLDKE